jgi:hypothetical protein
MYLLMFDTFQLRNIILLYLHTVKNNLLIHLNTVNISYLATEVQYFQSTVKVLYPTLLEIIISFCQFVLVSGVTLQLYKVYMFALMVLEF